VAVRPRVELGRLVLYDRYFPDYVVDRKRYRVPASCQRLVELVARYVPQPDLYLVLGAPAQVLYERKQELSATEMSRQLREYRHFAKRVPNATVIRAERPHSAVLEDAIQCIIERHLS
jgi:thymidylate kinase